MSKPVVPATNFDLIARPPSTNNVFELLPLDEDGNPWCGVRPRSALVTVTGANKFTMSASWEVPRDDVSHPARVALLLAGAVVNVAECSGRDSRYAKGDRLHVKQEVAFNRNH